eukprot:6178889-Pleurochrysis_carterae.AAC.2
MNSGYAPSAPASIPAATADTRPLSLGASVLAAASVPALRSAASSPPSSRPSSQPSPSSSVQRECRRPLPPPNG